MSDTTPLFLITGGGTGAKVAEALVHLCAAGLGPAEALGRLRERGGTHLDPAVVDALASVLSRRRGGVGEERTAGGATTHELRGAGLLPLRRSLPDHDLPEVSDAFARWQPEPVGRRA